MAQITGGTGEAVYNAFLSYSGCLKILYHTWKLKRITAFLFSYLILRFLAGFRGIINPIVLVHSLTGVMVSKRYITLEYICLTRF